MYNLKTESRIPWENTPFHLLLVSVDSCSTHVLVLSPSLSRIKQGLSYPYINKDFGYSQNVNIFYSKASKKGDKILK